MVAIALALSASLAWGCSDFLGGLMSRRLSALAVLFLSQCAALGLFSAVVFVSGARIPDDGQFIAYAVVSALAEAIALGTFYRGLAIGAMGVVAPIAACAAVVPVAYGLATGESPSAIEAVGIPLAVVGVVLVAWQPIGEERTSRVATGVGLAFVAALGFGTFFVAIAAASERADVISAVFVNRMALVIMVATAVGVFRPGLVAGGSAIVPLIAIGVLDISGSTLFAAASTQGLLVIVGTLGALYPIMTVVLARVMLKERLAMSQRVGTAIGLLGVALISAGAP